MRAFIIRPFGKKRGIDFDRVEAELIDPALNALEITGRTTGEILEAGNIRTDMFQQLLVADIVIADISTNNANAFYELGIRQALRARHTFLLRTDLPRDALQASESDQVPFDLLTDRYLKYDGANPATALPKLIAGLQQTVADSRQDSPVFLSLPLLREQDTSRFTPVPSDFAEEVELAAKDQAQGRGRLIMLGLEARGFTWEAEGMRTVGKAQFDARYGKDAIATWEAVREIDRNDKQANLLLATLYQRCGDLTRSTQCLQRLLTLQDMSGGDLAETYALLGRNTKTLWLAAWRHGENGDYGRQALASPLLEQAYEDYRKAFEQDLNAYYPGINALGLVTCLLQLASAYPDIWKGRFEDDDTAEAALRQRERQRQDLIGAMTLCIEANRDRKGDTDHWLNITDADLRFLTTSRPSVVTNSYAAIMPKSEPFEIEAIRSQLSIYGDLDILRDNVAAAFDVLGKPSTVGKTTSPSMRLDQVIVFAGHRIDDPGRKVPRFPQSCQPVARDAIARAVQKVIASAQGEIRGFAGAASGGDILFHEVCRESGIDTRVCLALPEEQYLNNSVRPANADWVDRFKRLVAANENVLKLADSAELPRWLTMKPGYNIWQRNNLWELGLALAPGARRTTLIALWDGAKGDGPGGTEDMVSTARRRGAGVEILDTKKLFGL